jgi:hypothetical protein
LALLIAALLVPEAGRLRAEATATMAPAAPGKSSVVVAMPLGGVPEVVAEAPVIDKSAYPKLEPQLAALYESAVLNSARPLETFAGQDHIDLVAGTARVIIEMDVDPQAHQTGPATLERVVLEDGRTATIEHAPPTAVRADLAAAIAATGAQYELGVGDLVQVLAPFRSLKALSEIPGVRVVRLPFPAQEQEVSAQTVAGDVAPDVGTYTSEGVSLTGIGAWHAAPFYQDGTGIKLAVFDFGFTNWAARQASGDLPSGGNLVNKDFSAAFSFPGNTAGYDHGTACAEIAYDMAPGSTLYLYAWGTDAEFASAVDDYRSVETGKRVATISIGWVNAGPYDGTGSTSGPATKVNQAQSSGIFWANAAGNYQQQHYSWTSAEYSTTNYVLFGTNQYQEYGPTESTYWAFQYSSSGTVVSAYLEWPDWNSTRDGNVNHVDYDLRLWRSSNRSGYTTWTNVASSLADQCSLSAVTPTEALEYTLPSTPCASPYYCLFRLTVERYDTGCTNNFGHWMELFSFNGAYADGTGAVPTFYSYNTCNSLTIPADADGAVAVGATFWGEDSNPTYNYGLETFSSLGPRNAAGGTNPGTTVNKPNVVAPDLVSTVTYGASNGVPYRTSGYAGFPGTSAATPHVAGIAASLWERCSTCTLAQLRDLVEEWSLYKGTGGTCGGSLGGEAGPQSLIQNNAFGWGRINVGGPTAIKLRRFEAWPEGTSIHVQWETSQEVDNLGFNLYRSGTRNGPKRQLNRELIPTQVPPGSPFGAVYDWIDAKVKPGHTYFYWLEDVDLHGNTTMHGPVKVRMP